MKEGDVIKAIRDKLSGYEISGLRVFFKTKPSAFYLNGKIHNGTVGFVADDRFTFLDDVEGPLTIYYAEIMSPSDIMDSRKKHPGATYT